MPSLAKSEEWVLKSLEKVIDKVEREVLRNYKASLDDIRQRISRTYEAYAIKGKLTYPEMIRYNRLKTLEKSIVEALGPIIKNNPYLIKSRSGIEIKEAYKRYFWAIEQEAGVSLTFVPLKPEVIIAMVQNPISGLTLNEILSQNRRNIIIKIKQTITQGLIKGEAYSTMAKNIKAILGQDARKAMRVVRTEGQRAITQGHLKTIERIQDIGIVTMKMWIATLDGKTRDSHQSLDGMKVGQNADFKINHQGAVISTPGPLMSGVASFDINCRCALGDVLIDYPPKMREARGKGKISYTTYSKWHT